MPESEKHLWKPGLLPHAVKVGDIDVETYMEKQVLDADDPECGGIRSPETLLSDGLATSVAARCWSEFWSIPESKHYRNEDLLDRIKLALKHVEEYAQNEDGSVDGLNTGDMGSAPHAAFCVEALYPMLKLWETIDHPAAEPICDQIRRCITRAGNALRTKTVYTHNHRWAACGAMAFAYDVSPDPRLIEKIDDYVLGDGIDQDEDGYYAEYSAGYGMLSNRGIYTVGRMLNRPHLFQHLRRNFDLLRYLMHSNGEVVCEYAYRNNDRGGLGSLMLFVEMAKEFQDGRYLAIAEAVLDRLDDPESDIRYGNLGGIALLQLARQEHPGVETVPLEESYRKTFARGQVGRIRRGKFSATVMGRPANPEVPFLGKPFNTNFLAVRHGDAVIDGTRISYAYYGDRVVGVPEDGLKVEGDEYAIYHDFTDHVDGPVPWRLMQLNPDFHAHLRFREVDGGIAVKLAMTGCPRVITHLEFSVRPDNSRMIADDEEIDLVNGEQHILDAPTVKIVCGSDVLELSGDLHMQHKVRTSGKFVNQPTYTSLLVNIRSPHEDEIIIRGYEMK